VGREPASSIGNGYPVLGVKVTYTISPTGAISNIIISSSEVGEGRETPNQFQPGNPVATASSRANVTDLSLTQSIAWAVNAAKGRAEEVYEKAKEQAFTLSRTAHNLVTPQTIAIQTAAANTAGALNNNYASRLDRNSRNVPYSSPPKFSSYNADIRAKMIKPIRPTLETLVRRNRLHPIRLDSIRTVDAMNIKVATNVQHINDISAFSFRQQ
jgi:hypothetical protein